MKNRNVLLVLGIIVVIGIVIGFVQMNKPQHIVAPKDGATKEIVVGAILPMTGELGFYGEREQKALTLYAETHPGVKFIIEDSKGTPKDGLSAATKLSSQGIRYYITSLSFIVNTVQPAIDKQKALNFTLNMDPRTEQTSKYCKRLYVTFYDEMDKLTELAKATKADKVAVLHVNVESMNNAVQKYLRGKLEGSGIQLYTDTYEMSTKDFRQQLLKLSATNPKIIRILDYGDKLPIILKQIAEMGLFKNTKLVTGIEILECKYQEFPQSITSHFYFTIPDLLMNPQNAIVQSYQQKFGSPPGYDAMFTWDLANLLVPAIRDKGYDNVDEVIKDITSKGSYKGDAANYTINQYGGVSPVIHWAHVDGKAIRFLESIPGGSP